MSQIHFSGNNPVSSYSGNIEGPEQPKKSGGVDPQTGAQNTPPETSNDTDTFNHGFVPDAPKGNADMTLLKGMVATLSPGALLAALCIKDAAEQNELNTEELLKHNDAVTKTMKTQADNIEEGAFQQMCFAIAGAVASAGMSIAAASTVAGGGAGDSLKIAESKGQAMNTFGGSISGTLNAVGGYINAGKQAENKQLDAAIENHRTMMETLRTSMQAQRDLINKSLEFINSMQANMNQTMSRIMG